MQRNHGQIGTLPAIRSALDWLPNDELDYDSWMRIGMALKGALGDAGGEVFATWSAQAAKDVPATTARAWASFKPDRIGAGTIYHLAMERGWQPDAALRLDGSVDQDGPHPAADLLARLEGSAPTVADPEKPIFSLTIPDGLVGDLTGYMLATARRPQPLLSLGASLCAIGALMGRRYPGEHEAIVTDKVWDQVDAILQGNRHARSSNSRMQTPAPLKGLIFTDTGAAMTPTATKKRGKLYRYYVSMDVIKNRTTEDDNGVQAPVRLPAGMVEDAIVTEVRRILQTPEVVTQVLAALKRDQVSEAEAIAALHDFNTLWAQLFPLEQARIIQLLVRRVTVTAAGLEVDIRREGVAGVIREMIAPRDMEAAE